MTQGPERFRTTTERRLREPDLALGRRLFPRGFAGLVPDERARFLAVCALVGALAALAAVAFRICLKWLTIAFFGIEAKSDLLAGAQTLAWWERLALPAAGAAAAAALARLVVRGGGGGVAGIMEAVSLRKGVVSLRAATGKAACALLGIASGGSVGREGPIIQLASAVASRTGRALSVSEERLRVLVACGAAAGFAAAYNTPMAATLFVVEVVAGTATVELLGPAAVAAVIATAVTHLTIGGGPLYGMKPFTLVSAWEFLPYTFLAVAAAVVSTVFLGTLDVAEWFFARTFRSRIVRGVAGGAVVGAIAIVLPNVYGNGFETTLAILDADFAIRFLLPLLLAKIVATAASVGSGGAGGVFTPTLLVGAALGGAVGDVAHAIAPHHTAPPGAYALVGMAALLAATTHAPLLATVFVFEVTGDYAIVLPLLLTGYVAAAFAKSLRPHSIYEEEAERRGIALDRNLEQRALKSLRARSILRPVPALPSTLGVEAMLLTFAASRATTLHVTNEAGRLVGVVDLHDARERLIGDGSAPLDAGQLARAVPTVGPEAPGTAISDALYRSGRDEVPVVDGDGRLLGVITRRGLAAAIDRDVIHRGLRVHETLSDTIAGARPELFALPAQSRLEQVRVPRSLVGKRISEARIREVYHLNVLALARRLPDGGEERRVVDSQTMLEHGEEMVVVGAPADVERFRAME